MSGKSLAWYIWKLCRSATSGEPAAFVHLRYENCICGGWRFSEISWCRLIPNADQVLRPILASRCWCDPASCELFSIRASLTLARVFLGFFNSAQSNYDFF
jgi:hypothetical protein